MAHQKKKKKNGWLIAVQKWAGRRPVPHYLVGVPVGRACGRVYPKLLNPHSEAWVVSGEMESYIGCLTGGMEGTFWSFP